MFLKHVFTTTWPIRTVQKSGYDFVGILLDYSYMIKTKEAFLEGRLLSSQSEQFEEY